MQTSKMKKAIVVGASSGIGNELAKILCQNGYQVGVTGRREALLEKLKEQDPESFFVSAYDCTLASNAQKLDAFAGLLGSLDLLVFSSGTGDLNTELKLDIETQTNALNVQAFTEVVNWGFQYFKNQSSGHLVVISSIAGIRGSGVAPSYNASKAYQINYLEGLRQKITKSKIALHITDIRPGFVKTKMAKGDGQFWVAPKQKAALQIFRGIQSKKAILYVTKRWRIIAWILRLIPRSVYRKM